MNDMFVMRRANGDVFSEEIDGKPRVPVWSSEEGLARYKERNPELLTFLPARLTRTLMAKIGSGLAGEGATFLLLDEDNPAADLDVGKLLPLEGILPGGEPPPQPARIQL
jgi:hypothetical protein